MNEKQTHFPNVSLKGKLNKQKENKGPGYFRYREKDQSVSDNKGQ